MKLSDYISTDEFIKSVIKGLIDSFGKEAVLKIVQAQVNKEEIKENNDGKDK